MNTDKEMELRRIANNKALLAAGVITQKEFDERVAEYVND